MNRLLLRCLAVLGLLTFGFFFTISASFGQSFVENFDVNTNVTSSVSKTLSGVQFDFVFTSNGDGGDFAWEPNFGDGNSPSLNLASSILNFGTTERVTISRQDGGTFIFSGIYINNTGSEIITVQGYNGINMVGSPQNVAAGVSGTLNFPNITVTEVRLTSTDFFSTNIDAFRGAIATNTAPTDITLLPTNINENVASNSTVGTFNSTDPDVGDTFTYTLVSGTGSTDNSSFNISGNSLRISNSPNFEVKNSYTIRVRTTDQGGLFYEEAFIITVNNVNEAPTVTAPIIISVNEDEPGALTGISFSDIDAGSNAVTVTFNVSSGTLSATSGGGVTVGGTPSARTLTGAINDINTFISAGNLTFTTALNSTSDVTLAININDNGNTGSGGDETAQGIVTINVTAENDAPVNTVPGAQEIDQNTSLVFSSVNSNLISISDVDAGGAIIEVSLSVTNGVLSLSSSSGLSFTTGTGVNNSSMVFQGTIAAINSALNGLIFTPNTGYNGAASISITTNDRGFSGSGGALTDSDTFTITVNEVLSILTITPTANQQKVFGAVDPASFTYTVSGFNLGDDDSILTGALSRAPGENVGTYAFNLGNLSAGPDYNFVLNPAVFTITPATITGITFEDASFDFDGTAKSLTITGTLPAGVSVSYSNSTRSSAGTQEATAVVSGSNYTTLILTAELTILPVACTSVTNFTISPSSACSSPATVFFTASSTDEDTDTWLWEFGNGATSTAQNPIYSYTSFGDFTVRLTASNSVTGCSSVTEKVFSNQLISADFDSNRSFGCGPLTVEFEDMSEGATSWTWDFGDGTTSTEQNPTHTYQSPGTFTVSLSINTGTSCTDTKTSSNFIQVIGPDVDFAQDVTEGCGPLSVSFTNSSSSGSPIISYLWNFGDGTSSTQLNPTHEYTSAGLYTVSLTVRDLDGCSRTLTRTNLIEVNILEVDLVSTNVTCNGGSDGSIDVTPSEGLAPFTYEWDHGPSSAMVNGLSAGNYSVKITDADGCSITKSIDITEPLPIQLTTSTPSSINFSNAVLGGELLNALDCAQESGIVYSTTANPDISDAKVVMTLAGNSFSELVTGLDLNTTYYVKAYSTNQNGITTYGDEVIFTTAKKTLTITADADQNKVYGDADPIFTYTATGFEGGDDESILTGALTRVAGEDVGTYTINLGTLDAGPNYMIDFISADFTITPATLTVTVDPNQEKVFGTTDPVFTYTATGFEGGDDESILTGTLIRVAGEDVGTYAITQGSLAANANYSIDFTGADFTITPATITGISFADASFTYDGAEKSLAITGALPTGTSVSYANNGRTDIGTQEVTATITGANYTTLVLTADLEITPAMITGITFADASFTYDGSEKFLAITGTLPTGTTVSYTNNGRTDVGTQEVTATIIGSNYTTLVLTADLEITPATPTLTWEDITATFGAADFSLTPPSSTSTGAFTYSIADTQVAIVTGNTISLRGLGTTTITASQAATTNYTAGTVSITLTVINAGPTAISISRTVFAANQDPNTPVATLSTTDADDTQHTYFLVMGAGDTDNEFFNIIGNGLYLNTAQLQALAGKSSVNIRIRSVDPAGNFFEEAFTLTREALSVEEVFVPNTITPDGDGKNDAWIIPDLIHLPDVRIIVVDRDGRTIFETRDPSKAWDGLKDMQGASVNKGVYYYIIEIMENGRKRVLNGNVLIL